MLANQISIRSFFIILLVSVILVSILPQPASADLPPGGKWNITAEDTWKYFYPGTSFPAHILSYSVKGEFNDVDIVPGKGNVTGTLHYQFLLPPNSPCTLEGAERNYQINADLIVWPGSKDPLRNLQFIDKNPVSLGSAIIKCPPDFSSVIPFQGTTQDLLSHLDALASGSTKGDVPLKEGTYELDRSGQDTPGSIWKNKYTLKPEFCKEVVQIPLVVDLVNNPKKPDGSPVDELYVNDFVKIMSDIYKQACVNFKVSYINKPTVEADPGTYEGRSKIRDFANTEMAFAGTKLGSGAKISVVNGLGTSGGKTLTNKIHSIIVDTTRQYGTESWDVDSDTWAHEMLHAFGYGHKPGQKGYTDSLDPNNLLYPGVFRIGTKITPTERQEIVKIAKQYGKTKKLDPVKVNFIRDWKLNNASAVFFYTNSTPTAGYNFINLSEVFIYSEEPYSSYDFKIGFKDILALNQSANTILRLFFDTDGNPLTGSNGYDRIALINVTGTFPFNGTYRLEILNATDHTQILNGTTNITSVINYEEIDSENFSNTSYEPPFGYDLSFDISDLALNALNLSSKKPNVLVQVDYPAAQIRDEMNFSFSNSPEVSPQLTAEPYTVMPNDNITVNGSGFSPNTNVNISINSTQLASVATDSNGNFSVPLQVPDLAQDWYTVTAEDTNMQYDFTIINVAIPTPWTPPIIDFAPDSPVNDAVGATRTFDIIADQNTNVTWYINGTEVFNQTNVSESSYTNTSAAQGVWNVSAVVANATNGSAMQTWVWDVTAAPAPTFNVSGFKINSATSAGIAGWNITLTNSTMQATAITDMNGFYEFTGLSNGTYNVTEETRSGFTNISPTTVTVTVNGSDVMNINFTNQPVQAGMPVVDINITRTPVINQQTSDILSVDYRNFNSSDPYNISITKVNDSSIVYAKNGTLTGGLKDTIPIDWIPRDTGKYLIEAEGKAIVGTKEVTVSDSEVISPTPELSTIVLTTAGLFGLGVLLFSRKFRE